MAAPGNLCAASKINLTMNKGQNGKDETTGGQEHCIASQLWIGDGKT
jgi:hypothetical protein